MSRIVPESPTIIPLVDEEESPLRQELGPRCVATVLPRPDRPAHEFFLGLTAPAGKKRSKPASLAAKGAGVEDIFVGFAVADPNLWGRPSREAVRSKPGCSSGKAGWEDVAEVAISAAQVAVSGIGEEACDFVDELNRKMKEARHLRRLTLAVLAAVY